MRKSGSFLSMENLDLDGGSDDVDIHSTNDLTKKCDLSVNN